MFLSILILLFLSLLYLITVSVRKKHNYWRKKHVMGPKPVPFIGNFTNILFRRESLTMYCKNIYSKYANEKVVGIYQGSIPMLVIRDPELIKDVLIKDFGYFSTRGTKISNDVLSDNLFSADVDTWRKLRHGFSPMFSSGKLKAMSPLIDSCVNEFQIYVDKLVDKNVPREMRTLMATYTLEVIGSCAFGLKLNALTQEDNLFREIAESIFKPRVKSIIWRGIDTIIPGAVKFLNISVTNPRITTFFQDLVKKVVKEREGKATARKDFMDLLIEMRERGKLNAKSQDHDEALYLNVTDDVMAAEALVFYAAGFETSSAAMSFLLHEIAFNQECQDNIYKEIDKIIKKHGGITYDAVCEMSYLEMAFDEVLRKHPPGGVLIRKCISDYTFSNMKLKINKGVRILIPVYGLHHDPEYFQNPEEFEPQRFSSENKQSIHPCSYIPFGDGPRNCIGMRFAKIESMMGLAGFLHKFKVEPSSKSNKQLEYEPSAITLKSQDGIWLNIKRR